MAVDPARQAFRRVQDIAVSCCRSDEALLLSYYSEQSDFVRINYGRIRQAGHVVQSELQLTLIQGQRNAEFNVTLSGDEQRDTEVIRSTVNRLRELICHVSDDPHLEYAVRSDVRPGEYQSGSPPPADAIDIVLQQSGDLDLVGLWACGSQCYGFGSSFGQSEWFSTCSFNLDASAHLASGSAVKVSYAGREWDPLVLRARLERARQHCIALGQPARALSPGLYRAYLAPTALAELMYLLSYSGFSRRALENRCSPLQSMHLDGRVLSENVTLHEARREGFLPRFSRAGFDLPDTLELIDRGRAKELLVDRRSSLEYGITTNADAEAAMNLAIAPGVLDEAEMPALIGSGLYISNLWYSNFSDLHVSRVTGSTRFACFWVDQGQIVAPLMTSRFDDSLLAMLGSKLVGLSSSCESLLSPGTYGRRSGASMRLPGVLVEDMQFVM